MSKHDHPWQAEFTRWFFVYRTVFYVGVAFLVRESVVPGYTATAPKTDDRPVTMIARKTAYAPKRTQSEALSDFAAWSATFASRLERAMDTGVAE